ncbi:MAG: beta-lactamase family protein [Candidatus Marinimicrobia bacterium]|nr:beta-lactamase family protein [Candidatus Neomarinimicrobiota bacterium]
MKTEIKVFIVPLIIMAVSLLFTSSCSKEDDTPLLFDDKTIKELETIVIQNMIYQGYEIPGITVGIWTTDQGKWVQAFGNANLEPIEVMTVDKGFRIGSVTKTFTATVILQMVDRGQIDLDETINNIGFNDVHNSDMITVKQLLNMTSGLPDYIYDEEFIDAFLNNPTNVWTPQELINMAMARPVNFQPGEDYEYCNINYILLGMIIEEISGSSYESMVESNIIEPLGLTNTFFPEVSYLNEDFCSGYSINNEMIIYNGTVMDPSFAWSAGGMVSNLEDMSLWARALGQGTFLSNQNQQERMTWNGFSGEDDPYIKYCLGGWWYSDIFYGHTGVARGYTDAIYYMPSTESVFVIIANADYADIDNIFEKLSSVVYPENVEW